MTAGAPVPGLAGIGYRAVGALAAACPPGPAVPSPTGEAVPGLRGEALDRLRLLAARSGAAGLCGVRFTSERTPEGTRVTASGQALDVALPAWSVERPRLFVTTLDPEDLVAILRAGYRPRDVVVLELHEVRPVEPAARGGLLPQPDRGLRHAWLGLRPALAAAARRHRPDLLLTGPPEVDAHYLPAAAGPPQVALRAGVVADVFRDATGGRRPAGPADPDPRATVRLRRPTSTFDPGPLADRVRP